MIFNPSTGFWVGGYIKAGESQHLLSQRLQSQCPKSYSFLPSYVAYNWNKVDNGPLVIVQW
jgi:hypothetical protein